MYSLDQNCTSMIGTQMYKCLLIVLRQVEKFPIFFCQVEISQFFSLPGKNISNFFSARYEYLWQDGNKKPEKLSAPE